MTSIPIYVVADPDYPGLTCSGANLLQGLASASQLSIFEAESLAEGNTDGLGNCHQAVLALIADLGKVGENAGWCWIEGRTLRGKGPETMLHSWLEYDGWAFDVANGKVVAMQAAVYRRCRDAREIRIRDAALVFEHMQTRRSLLG